MLGILVHGDNHFIVRGPLPNRDVALALIRHWSLIQIGATTPLSLDQWHIRSRELRETRFPNAVASLATRATAHP
jgi:hypothetical protein